MKKAILETLQKKLCLSRNQLNHLITELSSRNELYWLNRMWKFPLSVERCRSLPFYRYNSKFVHLLKPHWLLKLLPLFDYICPKCKKEVKKNSNKCPFCGEQYGSPLRVPPEVLSDSKELEDYVHKQVFPRVSKAQRDYLAQFFTEFLNSGWEDSGGSDVTDGGKWDYGTGTYAVVEDPVHSGSYGATFTNPSSFVKKVLDSDQTVLNVRCYFYLPTMLGNSQEIRVIYVWQAGWGWLARVGIVVGSDGTKYWRLQTNDGNLNFQDDTINAETWYCLEIAYEKGTGSDGIITMYVDGNQIIQRTDATNTGDAHAIYVGNCASWTPTSFVTTVDDVIVADAYIGPIAGVSIPVIVNHLKNQGIM